MIKRIFFTLFSLLLVIGAIAGVKFLQIRAMIDQGAKFVPPPETVTATMVSPQSWEATLNSVGSLEAVQGVTIAAELAGKVTHIFFDSGAVVRASDQLVKMDTSSEEAQLRAAEAAVKLAKINLDRLTELIKKASAAPSEYDTSEARFKEAVAQADIIRAAIAKKTIRAPFAGRLGIRQVSAGKILSVGDPIVTLSALDPIYVNFFLPQQDLAFLTPGLPVRISAERLTDGIVRGAITTINPEVDPATRNVKVQATIANALESLRPGMSVTVAVELAAAREVMTVPATAVLYAPYGDSVFVIEEKGDEKTGQPQKSLRQQFVRRGEKRGDFVAIVSGANVGELVVSTGVFKLRNGQAVVVDNTLAPRFETEPKVEDK